MNFIDKDILLQRINTQFWSEIENIIISAPSIDIVFCKECKHWDRDRAKRNKIQFKGHCDIHSGYCGRDKYCAWGERREP